MSLGEIFFNILWLCLYMLPLAIVANSKLSRGNEKTGWLLLTIVLSWVALVVYYSTVPNRAERKILNQKKMEREHLAKQALRKRQAQKLAEQQALAEEIAKAQSEAPVAPPKTNQPPKG